MSQSPEKFVARCTGCGTGFKLSYDKNGKQLKCPKCQAVFVATAPQQQQQPNVELDPLGLDTMGSSDPFAGGQDPLGGTPVGDDPLGLGGQEDALGTVGYQQQQAPQYQQQQAPQYQQQQAPQYHAPQQQPADGFAPQPATASNTHQRCHYCHEMIPNNEYNAHLKGHSGTEEDGQLTSYPSLPPEKRYNGDLSKVPMTYHHDVCGVQTTMPEEIVRTYLVDPFFYAPKTYCGGCQKHVPYNGLTWASTRQPLGDYFAQLKANDPDASTKKLKLVATFVGVGVALGFFLGAMLGCGGFFLLGPVAGALLFLACVMGFGTIVPAILFAMRGGF